MKQRRTLFTCALLTALTWAASGRAESGFHAARTLELPREVAVGLDGAGGARITWRGETVARLELMLWGGPDHPGRYGLGVADGAAVPRTDLLDADLGEGQVRAARGIDDDGDGRVDEDPFDHLDNDGDGLVDEDFAAIGHQMHVSMATLEGAGLPGVILRERWSHWPYFHVDDVLFWNATLESDGPLPDLAPAIRVVTPHDVQIADETIEPHVTVGQAQARRVRFPYLQVTGTDGSRLYVAVVRLDGRLGDVLPDEHGIVWNEGSRRWPLAVVTAPTRDTLEFSAAQALLTYHASGEAPAWTVPPLCARCQQTDGLKAHLRLQRDGDDLELILRTEGNDEHHRNSAEGADVAGVALAPYLVQASGSTAEYRLPLESREARTIVTAAASRAAEVSLVLHNGLTVSMVDPDLQIASDLLAIAADESDSDSDFPRHLAPHLLQTWPNPFHENTTIRFEVPATLGDAFEFEPDDERVEKLDLQAAPPFGSDPLVRVRIYNVGGQLIRVLDERVRSVGHHSVSWDGADDQGMPVAAGAYYVNVEMGDYRVTRRVLRLKP